MPRLSVAAISAALPEETDEVLALGARLGAAMRQEEDLLHRTSIAKQEKKYSAKVYLNGAAEHCADEIYTLRDMIASVRAKSLAGAAVQIAEALARVDLVWDQIPETHETYRVKQDMRAINRLLYSALGVVDNLAEQKLADVVTPDFGSRYCDPWQPVEERCNELKARSRS